MDEDEEVVDLASPCSSVVAVVVADDTVTAEEFRSSDVYLSSFTFPTARTRM